MAEKLKRYDAATDTWITVASVNRMGGVINGNKYLYSKGESIETFELNIKSVQDGNGVTFNATNMEVKSVNALSNRVSIAVLGSVNKVDVAGFTKINFIVDWSNGYNESSFLFYACQNKTNTLDAVYELQYPSGIMITTGNIGSLAGGVSIDRLITVSIAGVFPDDECYIFARTRVGGVPYGLYTNSITIKQIYLD